MGDPKCPGEQPGLKRLPCEAEWDSPGGSAAPGASGETCASGGRAASQSPRFYFYIQKGRPHFWDKETSRKLDS